MGSRFKFTITAEHVRNPRGIGAKDFFPLIQCMGRLLPRDVGKRVYDCGSFFQVENDEQRDRRIAPWQLETPRGEPPYWSRPARADELAGFDPLSGRIIAHTEAEMEKRS
jgi:hypothetical protein